MKINQNQLLGETLKKAGLINDSQLQTALEARQYTTHLRVGEIMALSGWIEQKTANFFAEEWHNFLERTERKPIGYYLERSGLLTAEQIDSILAEQKKIWLKFGSVAVLQGSIEQETVDFFIFHLFPSKLLDSPLIGKKKIVPAKITGLESCLTQQAPPVRSNDDIRWID